MQKSGIALVGSGALIVIGLVLLVVGNQIILEGINQGNGKVSSSQTITVSGNFDTQETSTGIFAVQIMDFKDNTFSARILSPSDTEIISLIIDEETIEKEFDALENGEYKLIIESTSGEEIQVFGAIGPLPDVGRKAIIDFVSLSILVVGMIGLVGVGIYEIRKRKRSV